MMPFLHRMTRAQAEENPLWLVVLCDLMTNLVLFFLVMYSFTLQNPGKRSEWLRAFEASELIDPQQATADAWVGDFRERQAAEAMQELIRRVGLSDTTDVSVTERAIRVSLRNRLLFNSAEATLVPEAARTLAQFSKIIKQIPNEVLVEGHTDDVPVVSGPHRTNWELSVARAYSVIELLQKDGLAPQRLIAAGYGPYHPVAANTDPAGRALNRRVEIVILRGASTSSDE